MQVIIVKMMVKKMIEVIVNILKIIQPIIKLTKLMNILV